MDGAEPGAAANQGSCGGRDWSALRGQTAAGEGIVRILVALLRRGLAGGLIIVRAGTSGQNTGAGKQPADD